MNIPIDLIIHDRNERLRREEAYERNRTQPHAPSVPHPPRPVRPSPREDRSGYAIIDYTL